MRSPRLMKSSMSGLRLENEGVPSSVDRRSGRAGRGRSVRASRGGQAVRRLLPTLPSLPKTGPASTKKFGMSESAQARAQDHPRTDRIKQWQPTRQRRPPRQPRRNRRFTRRSWFPARRAPWRRVAELTFKEAVALRQAGQDVVVCGADAIVNRHLAGRIKAAVGWRGRPQPPEPKAGPQALPHFHQASRHPGGHCFYETDQRKARQKR